MSKKLKSLLTCLGFLCVTAIIFVLLTYLFRPTTRSGRANVMSYYNEEKNGIDVIALGASGTYRYYDPMVAWDAHGYTSFTYAVASMQGAAFITALKDIYRTQSPELVILDARRFTTRHTATELNPNVQRYMDCLDLNLNRAAGIHYFCSMYDVPLSKSIISYLDLTQYHDNYYSLWDKGHWSHILNRGANAPGSYKGFIGSRKVRPFAPFDGKQTQKELAPAPSVVKTYTDVLDYCEKTGIPILLVVSPCDYNETSMMEINYLERVARERGLPFLNLNTQEIYADMGVDFGADFYNSSHMNILGAEKYTRYLSDYIAEHYAFADHRGDPAYDEWNVLYTDYRDYAIECEKEIRAARENGYNGLDVAMEPDDEEEDEED